VRDTYAYELLQISSYTTTFRTFTEYSVFSIAILTISLMTLLTLLIRGGRRLKFSELEKAMNSRDKSTESLIDED
jgi:hypothetical protein